MLPLEMTDRVLDWKEPLAGHVRSDSNVQA
jgi:hypothetical protein